MKKDVTIQVEASCYDVFEALAAFARAVKANHASGGSAATELPADITAAVQNLVPAIGKLADLKGELGDDRAAFIRTAAIGGIDIAGAILE